MDFDMEELNARLEKKYGEMRRSVIEEYLAECGTEQSEMDVRLSEVESELEQSGENTSAELESARGTISELQDRLHQQSLDFTLRDVMARLGVKRELFDDVKLLANAGVQSAVNSDGNIDESAMEAAIADVIERIPSVVREGESSGGTTNGFSVRTGSAGNFPRGDDSAALMKNRLNSARAAGDNALSVAIISEAASMGISLR